MPVEFALRPRIRLREDPPPPRRARARLPKFALPALAYWLVIGGLVYAFVHHREPGPPLPESRLALVAHAPPSPPVVREWWRPLPPTPKLEAPVPPRAEPEPTEARAADAPAAEAEAAPTSEPTPTADRSPITAPEPPLASRRSRDPAAGPGFEPAPEFAPRRSSSLAGELPAAPPRLDFSARPAPEPVRAANSVTTPSSGSLPSCEAALAASSQDVDFSGGNRAADLPTQAIAAVLENGAWLSSCAVPANTAIDVCVAIKGGRVMGASVSTRPADTALASCVKRRAGLLQFPYSPRLDLARTRF